jgi:RimJ/RimL family protein N-acetyltransferase
VRHSGSFDGHVLYLAVEANKRLIGEIDARRVSSGLPSGVVELGIDLYDEGSRGKGFGTEAVALLVGELFERGEVERIEARTAVDNAAMCRLLARLGFVREGVLREYMPRGAGRTDYALYALLRSEWLQARSQSGSEAR